MEVDTAKLIRRFEKIEPRKWDLISSILEIADQIGDISDIVLRIEHYKRRKNKTVDEFLEDLKDEICDLIFMLIRVTSQIEISFSSCFEDFLQDRKILDETENIDFKDIQKVMTNMKLKNSPFKKNDNIEIRVSHLIEYFGRLSRHSLDYWLAKTGDTDLSDKLIDIKEQIALIMYCIFSIANFYNIDCDKEYPSLIDRTHKKLGSLGV